MQKMFPYLLFGLTFLMITSMTIHSYRATPLQLVYPAYYGNRIFIPDDNPTTVEGVELGRMLFYETGLSGDNRFSCASCHQQEKAFTDGKAFSTGIDGERTERSSMSLVNLLWVRNLFWDGRAGGLEKQAEFPIAHPHEMGNSMISAQALLQKSKAYPAMFERAFGSDRINGDNIAKALAQFERTLISSNSRYDEYLRGSYQATAQELNGIHLFFTNPVPLKGVRGAGCGQCHGGPKTFADLFHNNGLDSVPLDQGREVITGQLIDRGRFRVVTLRNIALTAPYMHDGRFQTMDEVIDHYNEHISLSPTVSAFLTTNSNSTNQKTLGLTLQEKEDLLSFLHMLTDSSFITDKRFSNPFK